METQLRGSTMEERAESLLDTGLGSDCEFIVGNERKVHFKACKAFLTRASPVFERMFHGGLEIPSVIEVPDIEPDVFLIMLKFMYGSKWSFESNEQAMSVCYGAHKYMLKELLDRCVEYLWPQKVEDVWTALQCASLYYLNDLKEAALKIVRVYSHMVLANPNFDTLPKACILEILQEDRLTVTSEIEVFEAVCRWAAAQCREKVLRDDISALFIFTYCLKYTFILAGVAVNEHNKREELQDVIRYIRFLSLSASEFAEGPGESDVLTSEEKLAILKTIVTNGRTALPTFFCSIKEPRKECLEYI